MEKLHILNSKEIKKINEILKNQFSVSLHGDYAYLMRENGKIYMVTRDFAFINSSKINIDNVGLYIATVSENHVRLSIEGSQILGKYAKKGIIEIEKARLNEWLKGENLEINNDLYGPLIVKNKNDFYGCGIAKNGTLLNHIPKERRVSAVFSE